MNIKKYLMLGGVALSLGLSTASCVGDLDLDPIDPNLDPNPSTERLIKEAMECYQGLATSGNEGPGSSIISGLDNGRGQYTRAIFMMNEFPTDECIWIWKDDGIYDLVTNTYNSDNGNIYGTYSRLYAHIAVCNKFIADAAGNSDAEVLKLVDEVRALRALSYYWVCDIFGRATFTLEEPVGQNPEQIERVALYKWLVGELTDLVEHGKLDRTPVYGRVGLDGAEALLARLYLNAQVYAAADPAYLAATDTWALCSQHCENIIARHQGGGYQGSGLANHYLNVFSRNNDQYMPGGGNTAENEILWGIPFDSDRLQSYGGTMFLINGAVADELGMKAADYGCSNAWKCMKATKEFSEHFTAETQDARWQLWVRGKKPYINSNGDPAEHEYKIANEEFGSWGDGYVCIKWNGLVADNNGNLTTGGLDPLQFPSTDLGLIRLSDVYLMYVEAFVQGRAGTSANAVKYVNFVRGRAGVSTWTTGDLTPDNILAERCRELYWELTRRSDLVRFGKFTGPDQMLWSWKGNALEGNTIDARYNVMPIPANILSASPSYKQNPGYPGGVAY